MLLSHPRGALSLFSGAPAWAKGPTLDQHRWGLTPMRCSATPRHGCDERTPQNLRSLLCRARVRDLFPMPRPRARASLSSRGTTSPWSLTAVGWCLKPRRMHEAAVLTRIRSQSRRRCAVRRPCAADTTAVRHDRGGGRRRPTVRASHDIWKIEATRRSSVQPPALKARGGRCEGHLLDDTAAAAHPVVEGTPGTGHRPTSSNSCPRRRADPLRPCAMRMMWPLCAWRCRV